MDPTIINDSTIEHAADFVAIVSTLLLIVVIFVEKKISSLSVGLLIFSLSECVSNIAISHLKLWSGMTADYGYAAWYLGWIIQNLIWLVLLVQFHKILKIHLSNPVLLMAWYYTLGLVIQAIDFFDRLTVDSGFFAQFYQVTTLTMNIAIVPIVGIVYWHELYKRRTLTKMQEA